MYTRIIYIRCVLEVCTPLADIVRPPKKKLLPLKVMTVSISMVMTPMTWGEGKKHPPKKSSSARHRELKLCTTL